MPAAAGKGAAPEISPDGVRDHFIGWQCRLRQHVVRHEGGRPGPGMTPRLEIESDAEFVASLIVLLVEKEPESQTAYLRQIVRRTQDPSARRNSALQCLCADYYQHPKNFSDALTALFEPRSVTAECLVRVGSCVLHFEQFGQRYRVSCRVEVLASDAPAFQATFWHNSIFNPSLSGDVQVLAFHPNWSKSFAEPPAH